MALGQPMGMYAAKLGVCSIFYCGNYQTRCGHCHHTAGTLTTTTTITTTITTTAAITTSSLYSHHHTTAVAAAAPAPSLLCRCCHTYSDCSARC